MTGASKNLIQHSIDYMAKAFKVKDLGSLKYFLGIEVSGSSSGIYLHQEKYNLDILADTRLTVGAKPSKIHMEQNHNSHLNKSSFLSYSNIFIYRHLVGRLIYLTMTRPDLAYSAQVLSQFIARPRTDNLRAAYKVLRYLKTSPAQGLFMEAVYGS